MRFFRFPKKGQPAFSCYLTSEFAAGIRLNFTSGYFEIIMPWLALTITW